MMRGCRAEIGAPTVIEWHRHSHRSAPTHNQAHLAALEAGLNDVELGRVDHEGHATGLGVRHKQVDKAGHGGHAINQPVVHVDVQHVRALAHLCA